LTINDLREAMETLESAVSASSETVARTLNVVRLLVNRDVINNNTEQVTLKFNPVFRLFEPPSKVETPPTAQNERQDDHIMISDNSEEIDTESDSEDEISQLGRYIRSTRDVGAEIEDGHAGEEEDFDNDDSPVVVDEREGGRVANPPFLTDGRGRVVWSGHANTSDLVDDETRTTEDQETIECSGRNKSSAV
jgi:E3 ubiquitin-protein ligase makorin